MTIRDITACIEEITPLNYAEGFDNVGLLVGDEKADLTGILVCHDALEYIENLTIPQWINILIPISR